MRQSYSDLYALFRHDREAEAYFNSLPSYIQDQISARYRSVDSLGRLHAYAESIQRTGSLKTAGQVFFPPPGSL